MRISAWSSDVGSSDLPQGPDPTNLRPKPAGTREEWPQVREGVGSSGRFRMNLRPNPAGNREEWPQVRVLSATWRGAAGGQAASGGSPAAGAAEEPAARWRVTAQAVASWAMAGWMCQRSEEHV